MIYSLKGNIMGRGENFFVIENGGVAFKAFANTRTLSFLSQKNSEVKVFCFLYFRENQPELYGFLEEGELKLFEMLNTVGGIGPKTALNILEVDTVPNIMAAIIEKRSELLTRTSGIGKRTAERIILELHSQIKLPEAKALTEKMDLDLEVEEALVGLGYSRHEVKRALQNLGGEIKTLEERIRQVLKFLGRLG